MANIKWATIMVLKYVITRGARGCRFVHIQVGKGIARACRKSLYVFAR